MSTSMNFFQQLLHDGFFCLAVNHTTTPSIPSIPISEKLTKMNYLLWRAQVLPALRAAQYGGLLTGTDLAPVKQVVITNVDKYTTLTNNPAYIAWVARDQTVLGYLLSSLTLRDTYACLAMHHDSRSLGHIGHTLLISDACPIS
jgi:hypothetical protein